MPSSLPSVAGLRLLLVEDDVPLASAVARLLRRASADVDIASTLAEVRARLASAVAWDVILLDQGLPDGDALEVLEELRGRRDSPAVVATSALLQDSRRALRLQAHGAVLLPKPFGEGELFEAIGHAQATRRARSAPPPARTEAWESGEYRSSLHYGSITLNLISQMVAVDGVPVDLQPTQFRILARMIVHAGNAQSVDDLVRAGLRGTHSDASPNIRFQIHALRRRLGTAGALIQTVAGGYGVGLAEPRTQDKLSP